MLISSSDFTAVLTWIYFIENFTENHVFCLIKSAVQHSFPYHFLTLWILKSGVSKASWERKKECCKEHLQTHSKVKGDNLYV